MRNLQMLGLAVLTWLLCTAGGAQEPAHRVVDAKTLTGKVMCGYQGWFNCQGDGADLGWTHWARRGGKPFATGNVTVDLWPDVSELGESERFVTGFRLADGSVAEVFSSHHRDTVVRHFQWMRAGQVDRVREDWQHLSQRQKITSDDRYLHHKGKPVVAVWGVGFNDDRKYSLQECLQLVQALKSMKARRCSNLPTPRPSAKILNFLATKVYRVIIT